MRCPLGIYLCVAGRLEIKKPNCLCPVDFMHQPGTRLWAWTRAERLPLTYYPQHYTRMGELVRRPKLLENSRAGKTSLGQLCTYPGSRSISSSSTLRIAEPGSLDRFPPPFFSLTQTRQRWGGSEVAKSNQYTTPVRTWMNPMRMLHEWTGVLESRGCDASHHHHHWRPATQAD